MTFAGLDVPSQTSLECIRRKETNISKSKWGAALFSKRYATQFKTDCVVQVVQEIYISQGESISKMTKSQNMTITCYSEKYDLGCQ